MKARTLMIVTAGLLVLGSSAAVWAITEADCVTFLGVGAGATPETGCTYNTLIGWGTGNQDTTGSQNTFVGDEAGYANTTGSDNAFVGVSAGSANITGYNNSFFGNFAGQHIVTGNNNTLIGYGAGDEAHPADSYNTYIGVRAGYQGSGNVMVGYMAGYYETGSNKLYIDNCYTGGNCTSPLIYGEFDNRIVQINGTVIMTAAASPSDVRYKKNIEPLKASLDKVMRLQGVSYDWKSEDNPGIGFDKSRQIGLIAQEVEGVIPELVSTDNKGYKSLSYNKLLPVLIEAIKEQQTIIKEQSEAIKELRQKLGMLDQLEAKKCTRCEHMTGRERPEKL